MRRGDTGTRRRGEWLLIVLALAFAAPGPGNKPPDPQPPAPNPGADMVGTPVEEGK